MLKYYAKQMGEFNEKYILLIFIFIVVVGGIGGVNYYNQYMSVNKEVITYSDELYLIVEEQEVDRENAVLIYEDILCFSLPVVKCYIDKGNSIELIWDEESLQFYGEVDKNDINYKIWLEDAKSLEIKASLIHKYGLAGIASWRKGFETADVWISLDSVLN